MNESPTEQIEPEEGLPAGWRRRKLKFVATLKTSNVDKHIHECEIPVHLCNYTDVYYIDRITSKGLSPCFRLV